MSVYRCPGCVRMHLVHPCFPGCGETEGDDAADD